MLPNQPLAIDEESGASETKSLTSQPLEGGPADWQFEVVPYETGDRNPVVFFDVA
jgi:hypothetical protein